MPLKLVKVAQVFKNFNFELTSTVLQLIGGGGGQLFFIGYINHH
jgi:hypothetical protein